MSITTIHEELRLEDLDIDDPNILHALCAWCYPDGFPDDAKYLCGRTVHIMDPDAEHCIVCDSFNFCPICGHELTTGFY